MNWWAVLLGVAASTIAVAAGAPLLLTIGITALLVITLETVFGKPSDQADKNHSPCTPFAIATCGARWRP